MAMAGEFLDEDDIGDVRLREAEDDELIACRHDARIVRNNSDSDVGQLSRLQQSLELSDHYGWAPDDAVKY